MPPASTGSAPSARWLEIEADRAAAGVERARAQGTLSGFFVDVA